VNSQNDAFRRNQVSQGRFSEAPGCPIFNTAAASDDNNARARSNRFLGIKPAQKSGIGSPAPNLTSSDNRSASRDAIACILIEKKAGRCPPPFAQKGEGPGAASNMQQSAIPPV
jgi:hypothetical protein